RIASATARSNGRSLRQSRYHYQAAHRPRPRSALARHRMNLTLLKCKLHGATVTDANLNYEGSIGIPRDLMDAAGLLPHEQVDVLNFDNGERFTTYVLEYPSGGGHIVINGPAAHKAKVGDKVIVVAYASMDEA